MHTDDDLIRDLGAAFRASTGDLTYGGRRQPPSVLPAALSTTALAGVAAAAVVGVAATMHGSSDGDASVGPAATATHLGTAGHHAHHSAKVTQTMRLAGFTIKYSYPAGTPDPVFAETVDGGVPAGAARVSIPGSTAQAWFCQDPATGDNALYLRPMTDQGPGQLFALLSSTFSKDRLVDLVAHPVAVPLVAQ